MKAWQEAIIAQDIDSMWEASAAAEWERLNEPDPIAKALKDAAKDMDKAIGELNISIDRLSEASSVLYDTPVQAKVDSFIETLEDIKYDLWSIKQHWERGERE